MRFFFIFLSNTTKIIRNAPLNSTTSAHPRHLPPPLSRNSQHLPHSLTGQTLNSDPNVPSHGHRWHRNQSSPSPEALTTRRRLGTSTDSLLQARWSSTSRSIIIDDITTTEASFVSYTTGEFEGFSKGSNSELRVRRECAYTTTMESESESNAVSSGDMRSHREFVPGQWYGGARKGTWRRV